jgi:hypothetical protein
MKILILTYFSLILISFAAPDDTVSQMKHRLQKIKEAAAAEQINYVEYPELLSSIPEFNQLQLLVQANWKELLLHLDDIAPADSDKYLFFDSLELLSPRNYIEALSEIVTLRNEGAISDTWLSRSLFPQTRLNLILVDNYRDASVIRLLESIKSIPDLDKELSKSISDILSGEAKRTFDSMREFEVLPTVSLMRNQIEQSSIRPAQHGEFVFLRTITNFWLQGWAYVIAGLFTIIFTLLFFIRRRIRQQKGLTRRCT